MNLVAFAESVRFSPELESKKLTIESASDSLKSVQTFCFDALNDVVSDEWDGMKLVFTCLMNGDDAAITNRMKAMTAETLSQRREEDAILTSEAEE